jgi:predicted NAD/FAD-binding protein
MIDVIELCRRLKYEITFRLMNAIDTLKNLQEDSLSAAYSLIDDGLLFEAKLRLKTLVSLWPKNSRARYLLVLAHILDDKIELAKKVLNELQEVDKNFDKDGKLRFFLENGNFDMARKVYYKNYSIVLLEKYIEEYNQ